MNYRNPVVCMLEYQSIGFIRELRGSYLHLHDTIVTWFKNQRLKYRSKSLVVYHLHTWNCWKQSLALLDMAILTYVLIPLLLHYETQQEIAKSIAAQSCSLSKLEAKFTSMKFSCMQFIHKRPNELCLRHHFVKLYDFMANLTFMVDRMNRWLVSDIQGSISCGLPLHHRQSISHDMFHSTTSMRSRELIAVLEGLYLSMKCFQRSSKHPEFLLGSLNSLGRDASNWLLFAEGNIYSQLACITGGIRDSKRIQSIFVNIGKFLDFKLQESLVHTRCSDYAVLAHKATEVCGKFARHSVGLLDNLLFHPVKGFTFYNKSVDSLLMKELASYCSDVMRVMVTLIKCLDPVVHTGHFIESYKQRCIVESYISLTLEAFDFKQHLISIVVASCTISSITMKGNLLDYYAEDLTLLKLQDGLSTTYSYLLSNFPISDLGSDRVRLGLEIAYLEIAVFKRASSTFNGDQRSSVSNSLRMIVASCYRCLWNGLLTVTNQSVVISIRREKSTLCNLHADLDNLINKFNGRMDFYHFRERKGLKLQIMAKYLQYMVEYFLSMNKSKFYSIIDESLRKLYDVVQSVSLIHLQETIVAIETDQSLQQYAASENNLKLLDVTVFWLEKALEVVVMKIECISFIYESERFFKKPLMTIREFDDMISKVSFVEEKLFIAVSWLMLSQRLSPTVRESKLELKLLLLSNPMELLQSFRQDQIDVQSTLKNFARSIKIILDSKLNNDRIGSKKYKKRHLPSSNCLSLLSK